MGFLQQDNKELLDIGYRLHDDLPVKTRRQMLRKYHDCFSGQEAVQFMVDHDLANTAEEALWVGQQLQRLGIIEHVTKLKAFENREYLYQFTNKCASTSSSSGACQKRKNGLKRTSSSIEEPRITKDMLTRASAAVIGSFLGDAACAGLNGITDNTKMCQILTQAKSVVFYADASAGARLGQSSARGLEGLAILHSFYKQQGNARWNPAAYAQDALESAQTALDGESPVSGVNTDFIRRMEHGHTYPQCGSSKSKKLDFFAKVAVVVAQYGHSRGSELAEHLTLAIKVHQTHAEVLAWGLTCARILEQIILGRSITDAFLDVLRPEAETGVKQRQAILKVIKYRGLAPLQAAKKFGRENDIHSGLLLTLQLVLAYEHEPFEKCIRDNAVLGGQSSIRAMFLGACLSANNYNLPREWVRKMEKISTIQDVVQSLAQARLERSPKFHPHIKSLASIAWSETLTTLAEDTNLTADTTLTTDDLVSPGERGNTRKASSTSQRRPSLYAKIQRQLSNSSSGSGVVVRGRARSRSFQDVTTSNLDFTSLSLLTGSTTGEAGNTRKASSTSQRRPSLYEKIQSQVRGRARSRSFQDLTTLANFSLSSAPASTTTSMRRPSLYQQIQNQVNGMTRSAANLMHFDLQAKSKLSEAIVDAPVEVEITSDETSSANLEGTLPTTTPPIGANVDDSLSSELQQPLVPIEDAPVEAEITSDENSSADLEGNSLKLPTSAEVNTKETSIADFGDSLDNFLSPEVKVLPGTPSNRASMDDKTKDNAWV